MSKILYSIKEYGFFVKESESINIDEIKASGNVIVPEDVFEYIETFILENKNEFDTDNNELMQISYKKGMGKIIKTKNYVGTIQTPKGIVIEILPKIYISNNNDSYKKTKKMFLEMIKSTKEIPFKSFNMASLDTEKIEILEVFIIMFLDEVSKLIKKGLRSSYTKEENNLNYLKGKLLINKHISKNMIRKEKFYVEYDQYNQNIAENKIIKATLIKLKNITTSSIIQNRIRKYLFAFDGVQESLNYKKDFSRCVNNRLMHDYKLALEWSRIFLEEKGFNIYNGKNNAYALLFPMEKVFEGYIASCIKKSQLFNEFDIIIQSKKDKNVYLFDNPRRFQLKPDIIIRNSKKTIIIDTKWKVIDSNKKNYGISQVDMYQMYAYAKKYNASNVVLVYPYTDESKKILNKKTYNDLCFRSRDDVNVQLYFFNIENTEESLKNIYNIMNN